MRLRFPDFWFEIGGHAYAIAEPHAIARAQVDAIREAARDAWNVFARIAPVMAALPDAELAAIGMPRNALDVCRHTIDRAPTFLGRFDFALTASGPKLLEFNAETPYFLWESFEIAGALASQAGFDDPNAGALDALRSEIARAFAVFPARAHVAVTAFNTWREDWFTAVTMARWIAEATGRDVRTVPISELRVTPDRLRAEGGSIDVLWRYYPLEHFASDPAGDAFFERILDGRLTTFNPPSALVAQNKATQAVIWGLRASQTFTESECAAIERVFLPTFLDPPNDGSRCVRKPVLGREGRSVAIVESGDLDPPRDAYRTQPMVYQRYVDIAPIDFTHPSGRRERGYPIATCFVANGVPTAVAMRVGERVTDVNAMMLPLGLG